MELNRLQSQLARQIVSWLQQQPLQPGDKISASVLARTFAVSRSPVRAALQALSDIGVLSPEPGRGFLLALPVDQLDLHSLGLGESSSEQLYQLLVADLVNARLATQATEAELLRRYGAERSDLMAVLTQLEREGVAQRKAGRGWQFNAVLNSRQAFDESYAYRKLLEPQAPLLPGYRLDLAATARVRERQLKLLDRGRCDACEIFEANAEFHEFVVAGAGNRFLLQAIQQQNQLRRFVEYQYRWRERPMAVTKSCEDHLKILDALEAGNNQRASHLLWLHLDRTSRMTDRSTRIDTENWQESGAD